MKTKNNAKSGIIIIVAIDQVTHVFNFRAEELPVIGAFIYQSLLRDASDFSIYTKYATPFPGNYSTKLGQVQSALSPVIITNELKVVTFRLYSNVLGLRPKIDSFQIFAKNAGSALTVAVKDMGMNKVRKAVSRLDVEDVIAQLEFLNQNITNNFDALEAQGFTSDMQDYFVDIKNTINTDNNAQNTKLSERATLVGQNNTLFNNFYTEFVADTADSGKLIFKTTSASKYKDYVIDRLLSRIRQDETQTEVAGKAADALGNPLDHAKIIFKPIGGGRTKTVYTNAEGNYIAKGFKPNDYNVIATHGTLSKVQSLTIASRDHLTVNLVLA